MHLVVVVKAEPSISAFKRLITIVSRLMDLQVFKRASLSCSEEKLAPYNEYVSSALNIFSETKLLLSPVALVQVSVLLNTPSKDEMDTMTIPWILLWPEGALGLWDSMRYSDQMPRCLADLKYSCTNWSVQQQTQLWSPETRQAPFEEHGPLTMVGFRDKVSTFVPPWLPSLESPFVPPRPASEEQRFVHCGLGTCPLTDCPMQGGCTRGRKFWGGRELWIVVLPEESL